MKALRGSILDRIRRGGRYLSVATATALAVVTPVFVAPSASAATIDHIDKVSDRRVEMYVKSPAMGRIMHVDVLLAANQQAKHPTLYMLDGAGSSEKAPQSNWLTRTDAASFFADKPVNVVFAVGGGGSMYTDWEKDDPNLGHQKWETFLTKELPPLVNDKFNGNGRAGVAGLSMGAEGATILAARHPSLYKALGAYSGCMIDSKLGQVQVRTIVSDKGGDPNNMWGQPFDPQWNAHDPSAHIDNLKNTAVFISTATGLMGPADVTLNRDPSLEYPETLIKSVGLEQIIADCTGVVDGLMHLHGVDGTARVYPIGTHSWPYWEQPMHDSWPTLRKGLGI
ncbi:MAG: esterase family protein [Mycobacterium sp.]|nr:esterase family protein [Mycobacterium sp.]